MARISPWIIALNYVVIFGLWQIFVVPFCLAVCRARGFVSHPEHRVLPETSWNLFAQDMRRRLRIWKVVWAVAILIAGVMGVLIAAKEKVSVAAAVILAPQAICTFVLLWLWAGAACMILAGPLKRPWVVVVLSNILGTFIAIGLVLLIQVALPKLGMPKYFIEYNYHAASGLGMAINFVVYYIVLLAAAAFYWTLRRAKAKGDRWFRFEQ